MIGDLLAVYARKTNSILLVAIFIWAWTWRWIGNLLHKQSATKLIGYIFWIFSLTFSCSSFMIFYQYFLQFFIISEIFFTLCLTFDLILWNKKTFVGNSHFLLQFLFCFDKISFIAGNVNMSFNGFYSYTGFRYLRLNHIAIIYVYKVLLYF